MEQTTYEPVIKTTEQFLNDQIASLQETIKNKDEHIRTVTQRSYADSADKNRMVEAMQEWTLEALAQGTIDESEAETIAEICGFDLTKEFELEVTVQYSITVNARDEESAMNLIHDIDFDSVSEPEGVTYLSSSVDRIDI
jgi:intergrase/recombinase